MKIQYVDTDGSKGILPKGTLGYDDYPAGGDAGRVYVGDGIDNTPLATKKDVQFLGTQPVKAVQYMSQVNSDNITVVEGTNAFSVGNITNADGASITVEDGAIYKIL